MKAQSFISAVFLGMMLTAFGCQKVEEIPLAQNEILPLAIGNSWTYADTIIVTSAQPSSDTVISETTFSVTEQVYLDRIFDENGSSHPKAFGFERLQGWKVVYGQGEARHFALFVDGETVHATNPSSLIYEGNIVGSNRYSCPIVLVELSEYPTFTNSNTSRLGPVVKFPLEFGVKFPVFPAFLHGNGCLIATDPFGDDLLNLLLVRMDPLITSGASASVSTLAGTFNCIDYGSQYWAEGVGMIESHLRGTDDYRQSDQSFINRTVEWKRSLIRYNIK